MRGETIQQQSDGYEQTAELGRKEGCPHEEATPQQRGEGGGGGGDVMCDVRDRGLIWMDKSLFMSLTMTIGHDDPSDSWARGLDEAVI